MHTFRDWAVVVLFVSGCSSNRPANVIDARVDTGVVISWSDAAAPDLAQPDARRTDRPRPDSPRPDSARRDQAPPDKSIPLPDGSTSALQAVVNTIDLPNSSLDYTHVYDSSGTAKNKLGGIIQALNSAGLTGFDFQAGVDAQLASGAFLLLLDVGAKSIVSDPAANVRAALGQDLDVPPNPSDNFSGSEPLGIQPTSPNMTLLGSIASGKLTAGPGNLVLPLPLGSTLLTFSLQKAEMEADLSSAPLSAMTNGRIYGLIPWTDVQGKLIPAVAVSVDQTYKDPATPASTKSLLASLFDANKDGTITAQELAQSAVIKLVLGPDVDSDGDMVADSLSVGVGFTAVKCIIK